MPALRRCSKIFAFLFEEPKGGKTAQRRALRHKGRVEQYLSSVREAEIRKRRADAWLDTLLPAISEADRKRTNREIAATMAGDYFRTVCDLIVLAVQTDVTRVAAFSLGGDGDAFAIPEIGITESRHRLRYHGGDAEFNKTANGFQGYALGADGALTTAHYQVCSRPANTDAHMSNLLLLMAQRMGVETDRFGDSNRVIAL